MHLFEKTVANFVCLFVFTTNLFTYGSSLRFATDTEANYIKRSL